VSIAGGWRIGTTGEQRRTDCGPARGSQLRARGDRAAFRIHREQSPLLHGLVCDHTGLCRDLPDRAETHGAHRRSDRKRRWLAGVGVLGGLLRYYSRVLVFNAAREIEYEVRNDLFAHLQRLPQSFFLTRRTGDLMSRCVNDLNSVRMLLGPGLLSVVQTPLLYLGAFAMMFWIDWQLALLVLVPYPPFMLFARSFGRGLHRWNIEVQEGLGELSKSRRASASSRTISRRRSPEFPW